MSHQANINVAEAKQDILDQEDWDTQPPKREPTDDEILDFLTQ